MHDRGGQRATVAPAVARTSIPTRYVWSVDGREVSDECNYTFRSDETGSFRLRFTASNDDGETSVETSVKVCAPDELPFSWSFAATEYRMAAGRTIRLTPLDIARTQGVVFTWTQEGAVLQQGAEPALCFASSEQGIHRVVVTASGGEGESSFTVSQELTVEVCAPRGNLPATLHCCKFGGRRTGL